MVPRLARTTRAIDKHDRRCLRPRPRLPVAQAEKSASLIDFPVVVRHLGKRREDVDRACLALQADQVIVLATRVDPPQHDLREENKAARATSLRPLQAFQVKLSPPSLRRRRSNARHCRP